MNKKKIINDPIYGFINIPDGLIFQLIEHPWFQRLRRIKQLGLTDLVYPGALHTRFHHALGAMHLMNEAILNLRSKGVEITQQETEASLIAILLHDIGHGPFSHALENSLLAGIKHEEMSLFIIHLFNDLFKGKLDLAIRIFTHNYHKKFLSQLVSSQLDVDRMDYLNRDSFFTGVSEGKIGTERILNMLNVVNGGLVVEEKAIYSIENFLNARRIMYWQVYLHKTTLGVEKMLILFIKRLKYLNSQNYTNINPGPLSAFINEEISMQDFRNNPKLIHLFLDLDDNDIWNLIKQLRYSSDPVLSLLSVMMVERRLFRVIISNNPIKQPTLEQVYEGLGKTFKIDQNDVLFLVDSGEISNAAYESDGLIINVLMKDGSIRDIAKATDLPNITAMSKIVKKYYLCWPKSVSL